jgi:hypothetical protein
VSDHRQRLAALAGRERLPAARDMRRLMERLAARPPIRIQSLRIRPRTRLRIERIGAGICIVLALAAALFLSF